MNDAQKRVIVEMEFCFYLAGYPEMWELPDIASGGPTRFGWVTQLSTPALVQYNASARNRLRSGSLALRPQPPIKVDVVTPLLDKQEKVP